MSAHWTEHQDILKVGLNPLPFVQQGMYVGVLGRTYDINRPDTHGCIVQDVYEDNGVIVARLEGLTTGRTTVMSCSEVRRCYMLIADFDPNLPDEIG